MQTLFLSISLIYFMCTCTILVLIIRTLFQTQTFKGGGVMICPEVKSTLNKQLDFSKYKKVNERSHYMCNIYVLHV